MTDFIQKTIQELFPEEYLNDTITVLEASKRCRKAMEQARLNALEEVEKGLPKPARISEAPVEDAGAWCGGFNSCFLRTKNFIKTLK